MALLGLFLFVERRAREPIVPLALLRNRVFAVAGPLSLIVGFALFGAVTFLPLYFQTVNAASPTGAGLRLVPLMIGVLVMSILSGQLISRRGRYKVVPDHRHGPDDRRPGPAVRAGRRHQHRRRRTLYLLVLGLGLGSDDAGARPGRPERGRLLDPGRGDLGRDTSPRDRRIDRDAAIFGTIFSTQLRSHLSAALSTLRHG